MQWAFLEVNTRQESLSRVLLVRIFKAKSRENKVTEEYATTWCDDLVRHQKQASVSTTRARVCCATVKSRSNGSVGRQPKPAYSSKPGNNRSAERRRARF